MTNFDFLKNETQFNAFSDACIEAEKSISVSPALCALGVRKSAERGLSRSRALAVSPEKATVS